jgi:hypothetical protein
MPSGDDATVIGLSSETLVGQSYFDGGGGLHIVLGLHSTLIVAMQLPSGPLNTDHFWFGVVAGWDCGIGGLTTFGGRSGPAGRGCCDAGCGCCAPGLDCM